MFRARTPWSRTRLQAITNVMFRVAAAARYISHMSTRPSSTRFRCAQCDLPEENCQCEKYCCLCQGAIDVRICGDGLMYCEPCRTACDYKTSD